MGRRAARIAPAARAAALAATAAYGAACNSLTGLDDLAFGRCVDPAVDCPQPEDGCRAAVCLESGACSDAPVPAGAPSRAQMPGDCQRIVCDGAGAVAASEADDGDVGDDGQECTIDACAEGAPAHTPQPERTACAQDGGAQCDALGACVVCIDSGECTLPDTCGGGGTAGFCGCAAPCPRWLRTFGDPNDQQVRAVATDAQGNVLVAGLFTGVVDFGAGPHTSVDPNDAYLVKLDPDGNVLWSRAYPGGGDQVPHRMAVDAAGNTYIAGHFTGAIDFGTGAIGAAGSNDGFVVKVDPSGALVWAARLGDAGSQVAFGVAVDAEGNVVVSGHFDGAIDFGGGLVIATAGLYDVFVAKLSPAGAPLWAKRYGDANQQVALELAADGTDLLLTGYFVGVLDVGGTVLTSADLEDVFLAKLDGLGNTLWARGFGGPGTQLGIGVAVDAAHDVLAVGRFKQVLDLGGGPFTSVGDEDLYVAKLDAAGNHRWSHAFGGVLGDGAWGRLDAAGDALLAGYFQGAVGFGDAPIGGAGGNDFCVAKLGSAAGEHVFSKCAGDVSSQVGNALALDPAGDLIVGGHFEGALDLGGGPATSAGLYDAFVAKLAP